MQPGKQPGSSIIPYYRVSTQKQGAAGLGIGGQQAAVKNHAKSIGGRILRSYTEVESGRHNDRPELAKALADCRRSRATLVIAKLDRLTRNTRFLLTLIDSHVDVFFCDLPQIPVGAQGRFILTLFAAVAELEAGMISERTKQALGVFKAERRVSKRIQLLYPNGVPPEIALATAGKLGSHRPGAHRLTGGANPKAARRAGEVARANADAAYTGLADDIQEWLQEGLSIPAIAARLNEQGHRTRRGKPWYALQVRRVLDRIEPGMDKDIKSF